MTRTEQRMLVLQRHRSMLVERAAVQRQAMVEAAAGLERPLHWLDAGMSFAHSVNPAGGMPGISTLLGTFLSMSTRFTRVRAWVARGLALLQIVKLARAHLAAHGRTAS